MLERDMIIAIPLQPQPILHTDNDDKKASWRWAYRNQWMGNPISDPSTSPGEHKLPMVGAVWQDGLNPLESGAASISKWAPYQRGWVINVDGKDRIIDKVALAQLDSKKHNDVIVYPDGQSYLAEWKQSYWDKHWVWMLYLK